MVQFWVQKNDTIKLDQMKVEKENLLRVVIGTWNLIDVCKKTGDFTSLK
jgi:hypothetical protein